MFVGGNIENWTCHFCFYFPKPSVLLSVAHTSLPADELCILFWFFRGFFLSQNYTFCNQPPEGNIRQLISWDFWCTWHQLVNPVWDFRELLDEIH